MVWLPFPGKWVVYNNHPLWVSRKTWTPKKVDQAQHIKPSLRPPVSPFIWVKLLALSSGLSAGYLYCSRSLVLQNSWRSSWQQPCHENHRPDLTADCFRFQLPSSLRRSKISFRSTESVVDKLHPMSRLIKSAKEVKISLSCKSSDRTREQDGETCNVMWW